MFWGKIRKTKQLNYVGLIISYLKTDRVGGVQEGIYGYPYLNHLIDTWPGDCFG